MELDTKKLLPKRIFDKSADRLNTAPSRRQSFDSLVNDNDKFDEGLNFTEPAELANFELNYMN